MEGSNDKRDLEARTLQFAKDIRQLIRQLPKGIINTVDGTQLVRSSGSVGANYIEAQESLSKKDFAMRIRISRKEAKESRYWLNLLDQVPVSLSKEHKRLIDESDQLLKILSSIILKIT